MDYAITVQELSMLTSPLQDADARSFLGVSDCFLTFSMTVTSVI
jgi:hypothetical protein